MLLRYVYIIAMYTFLCSLVVISLVYLGADDRTTGGAFASQYVAHHLVRECPSNQGGDGGGRVNHTKSLANLSRLFRQLKQQPLHSERVRNKLLVS